MFDLYYYEKMLQQQIQDLDKINKEVWKETKCPNNKK